MKPINWKEAAELIGIFSILASLIFVALQLQQEEAMTLSEMRSNMVANTVAINGSIIENADIWVRGNEGQELSPAEMAIYSRLVSNVNDNFYQLRQNFLVIEPEWEEHPLAQFAGFLLDNPGAHQVWLDREQMLNGYRNAIDPTETVTTDWIEAIESRIAILEKAAHHKLN